MKLKKLQSIFHMIANANSIVQIAIWIKNGIAKHVNVSAKIIVHTKKIIVRMLALVFSIWKLLRVIQKTRIKIAARAIYTYFFFLIHKLSFACRKTKLLWWRQWRRFSVFIVNCKHISNMLYLLTLNRQTSAGFILKR